MFIVIKLYYKVRKLFLSQELKLIVIRLKISHYHLSKNHEEGHLLEPAYNDNQADQHGRDEDDDTFYSELVGNVVLGHIYW